MRNPHCALQPGLNYLLLVHSPLLGGPACCACGLQVQAGRAVSDLRPLSCLMHPLLMQIQLQSGAAWFWQGHLWQCSVADPGWHCALHRVIVPWLEGTFLCRPSGCSVAESQCLLQPAVLQRSVSAHRFSSALLSSQQRSCVAASPPQPLSLQQMCFQDKNNTVNCKSPSAFLFACTQQTVCLGMACVGTHRL